MENRIKYNSYVAAYKLIQEALEHKDLPRSIAGVAVAESMIADRCQSYLMHSNPELFIDKRTGEPNKYVSTGKMASVLKKKYPICEVEIRTNSDTELKSTNLFDDITKWLNLRNVVCHGFAKSKPSTPTATIEEFHLRAIEAAQDGLRLAKCVSKWHKQQLSRSPKQ